MTARKNGLELFGYDYERFSKEINDHIEKLEKHIEELKEIDEERFKSLERMYKDFYEEPLNQEEDEDYIQELKDKLNK